MPASIGYETTCPSCQAIFDVGGTGAEIDCPSCKRRIRLQDEFPLPVRPVRAGILLTVGLVAPFLLAGYILQDLPDRSLGVLALLTGAVAFVGFVALVKQSSPWRTGHGPAVLVAAAAWAVATMASGDAFGFVLVVLPIAALHALLLLAGLVFLVRRQPKRAVAFGHIAAVGPLVGLVVGSVVIAGLAFLT